MKKCSSHLVTCRCLAGPGFVGSKVHHPAVPFGLAQGLPSPPHLCPWISQKPPRWGWDPVLLEEAVARGQLPRSLHTLWSRVLAGHGEQATGLALRTRPRAACLHCRPHPRHPGFGGRLPPPSGSVRLLLTRPKGLLAWVLAHEVVAHPGLWGTFRPSSSLAQGEPVGITQLQRNVFLDP